MNYIEELNIEKSQFYFYINFKGQVKHLNIVDVTQYTDVFYLENVDYFIKQASSNVCINILFFHQNKLTSQQKKALSKVIFQSKNWKIYQSLFNMNSNQRILEAEEYISKDPESACNYAINVLHGRWVKAHKMNKEIAKEAEKNIAFSGDSKLISNYAIKVLNKPWEEADEIDPLVVNEAEKTLINNLYTMEGRQYLRLLRGKRWIKMEENIFKHPGDAINYAILVLKKRLSESPDIIDLKKAIEIEKQMIQYPGTFDEYINETSKNRLPVEVEEEILKGISKDSYDLNNLAFNYAYKIFGRWPELEKKLIKINDKELKIKYARNIIRGPWPEGGIK
jgi:hypothetical protein